MRRSVRRCPARPRGGRTPRAGQAGAYRGVKGVRQKRGRSIFSRMIVLLITVLLLQMAVFLLVFQRGGVVEQTERNAFYILSERTANRKLYLQNEMLQRWSNTQEGESEVLAIVRACLEETGKSAADLREDSALCQQIAALAADDIIAMLRRNGVTGAFLVLDCPGEEGSYPGVYVRDYDPSSYSENNADLLLERGLPTVARENAVAMDSYWSAFFHFNDATAADAAFFFAPLEAAQAAEPGRRESRYFNRWSDAFALSDMDRDVVAYSVPLVWEDGTVLGVLGVDLTTDYLAEQLRYEELGEERTGAYFLGVSRDGGESYTPVCESGPNYRAYFGQTDRLYTRQTRYDGTVVLQGDRQGEGRTLYGAVQPIHLYDSNTPFEGEQWALIGILEGTHLLSFSRHISMLLTLSLVVSLVLGLVLVTLAARTLTRPITGLVNHLHRSDPDKPIRLDRIRISEIDSLTEAIESLSNAAVESAARTSKIIELTHIPIGVFEYRRGSGRVFCSRKLFELLDWPEAGGEDGYLSYGEFRQRMDPVEQSVYDRQEHIHRLRRPDGSDRWIQLSSSEDSQAVLGAVQDVTHDMEAKRKMEYERDFDVLTDLYNRRAFDQRMTAFFTPERRGQLGTAALLMFDLDNLKYVNDTYGHDSGDRYIQTFARGLEFFYRSRSMVGRRSGDEFNVFLYGFSDKEEIRSMVAGFWRAAGALSMPLPGGAEIKVRASGGLAWYPDNARTYDELLHKADFAMYNIKHTVKGVIKEFDRQDYEEKSILIHGQDALNRLLDGHLVRYAFQPIVAVEDAGVVGYELLMRPQVEQLANLADLMRLAKSQSKLYQVERLTWFEALAAFARQAEEGRVDGACLAFINSLGSQALTREDAALLEERYGWLLGRVVLELTEEERFTQAALTHKKRRAAQWHCGLALDDYGSGFNSESVLIQIQPDIVKVDISIIRDIGRDAAKQKLLANFVSYARERGVLVLAEGVENAEELATVIREGVDLLQGFYLARPAFAPPPIPEARREEILRLRRENGFEH